MAAAAPHRDPPRDPLRAPSRRRRPRTSPNPLFTLWLREWRDEARGTWARSTYERALRSLSLFPLRLRSGRSAAILQHFGPALCERLERRLRQHRREQGLPPTPPREGRGPEPLPAPPTRRPRKVRPLPCTEAKDLPVVKILTDPPGSDPGSPIGRSPGGPAPCPAVPGAPPGRARRELSPLPTPCDPKFELRPGEFDIVLCADITEANGPRGGIPALLRARGIPVLLRRLHVGDFLWVARERDPPTGHAPRELVLDVVVERKSAVDLGNSLRDGRYREQKFRLRRSGLRFPIYLLEAPGEGEPLPLPLPTLRQAAANTQVVDGFFVKHTRDPQESATYLGILGGHLKRRFEGRVLQAWGGDVAARGPPEPPGTPCTLLPFQRLREGGGKNQAQTVGDVFARQLLQLGGLSGGRAAAVLCRFPTPASLMDALGHCLDPQKCQDLLSALHCGPSQRNLGPSLSRSLVQLYRTPGPLP